MLECMIEDEHGVAGRAASKANQCMINQFISQVKEEMESADIMKVRSNWYAY